jgi:hypothetical protein
VCIVQVSAHMAGVDVLVRCCAGKNLFLVLRVCLWVSGHACVTLKDSRAVQPCLAAYRCCRPTQLM